MVDSKENDKFDLGVKGLSVLPMFFDSHNDPFKSQTMKMFQVFT